MSDIRSFKRLSYRTQTWYFCLQGSICAHTIVGGSGEGGTNVRSVVEDWWKFAEGCCIPVGYGNSQCIPLSAVPIDICNGGRQETCVTVSGTADGATTQGDCCKDTITNKCECFANHCPMDAAKEVVVMMTIVVPISLMVRAMFITDLFATKLVLYTTANKNDSVL